MLRDNCCEQLMTKQRLTSVPAEIITLCKYLGKKSMQRIKHITPEKEERYNTFT